MYAASGVYQQGQLTRQHRVTPGIKPFCIARPFQSSRMWSLICCLQTASRAEVAERSCELRSLRLGCSSLALQGRNQLQRARVEREILQGLASSEQAGAILPASYPSSSLAPVHQRHGRGGSRTGKHCSLAQVEAPKGTAESPACHLSSCRLLTPFAPFP